MAPTLSEDEIDDLIYFSRAGEDADLREALAALATREGVSTAEILAAARDEGRSTCLHMATGNGHIEIVKLLLDAFKDRPQEERQAFLDAPNEYGNTGLHWAAVGGHLDTVKLLVEGGGASPALANDKNYVPLDLASFGEKFDVVDYFLAQSGGIEVGNQEEAGEEGGGLDAAVEGMEVADDGEGVDDDAVGEEGEGAGGDTT